MNLKFSNAEKVSNRFLGRKIEQMEEQMKAAKSYFVFFPWERFHQKLEFLQKLTTNNYQKLKDFIHLEREIEAYFSSKEIIKDVLGDTDLEDGPENKLKWYLILKEGTVEEKNQLIQIWNEKFIRVPFVIYDHGTHEITKRPFSFAPAVMALKEEDKKELEVIVEDYYLQLFHHMFDYIISPLGREELDKPQYRSLFHLFSQNEEDERAKKMLVTFFRKEYENFLDVRDGKLLSKYKRIFFSYQPESYAKWFSWLGNELFWNMIFATIRFNDQWEYLEDLLSSEEPLPPLQMPEYHRVKVDASKGLTPIVEETAWIQKDFRGIDLSEYESSIYEIYSCQLEGTNLYIRFQHQTPFLFYIKGKKFDPNDLTMSCLKGCQVGEAITVLNDFIFTSNTFDEKVIRSSQLFLESVSDEIREKFYRRIWLSGREILEVLQHNPIQKLEMRYAKDEVFKELDWIFFLEEMIPGSLTMLLQ